MSRSTHQGDDNRGNDTLSRDDLFEVLSNRRRRHVIHYLKQQTDGQSDLSDVVERIAAWENGTDVDRLTYDDRKSVHISLYQHHAPKMDEVGVIEYDKRAGTLKLTEQAADLDVFLERTWDPLLPWELYFPVVSVIAALVVLIGWLTPVGVLAAAWIVVAAIVTSAVVFYYDVKYRQATDADAPPPEIADGD